ncbi:hypothetical protein BDP55DRAFT_71496 [Colletotrichum godetiae]|uniref:Uncharacterized protein n=1 Tax=Colletotrichum godetiae TaxID=1209918 RepID=A0AAJ0APB5_9PEZI|nr:uncharacterized protein BDP55DRAFT_71496 [Colletotrichum godetiae]KAK1687891.1 hypothetical protein BDP55DRAFT_71496 [Colletotrichum godetiae]
MGILHPAPPRPPRRSSRVLLLMVMLVLVLAVFHPIYPPCHLPSIRPVEPTTNAEHHNLQLYHFHKRNLTSSFDTRPRPAHQQTIDNQKQPPRPLALLRPSSHVKPNCRCRNRNSHHPRPLSSQACIFGVGRLAVANLWGGARISGWMARSGGGLNMRGAAASHSGVLCLSQCSPVYCARQLSSPHRDNNRPVCIKDWCRLAVCGLVHERNT